MALAAGWRQRERHTRVDLLVVLPVVNLGLVENQLPPGFVSWRGHPGSCAGLRTENSRQNRNIKNEIVAGLRDSHVNISTTSVAQARWPAGQFFVIVGTPPDQADASLHRAVRTSPS